MSEVKTAPIVEVRASRLGLSVTLVLSADTTFLAQSLLETDGMEHLYLVYKKAVPRIAEQAAVEVLALLERFSQALEEETEAHARSYFRNKNGISELDLSALETTCGTALEGLNL